MVKYACKILQMCLFDHSGARGDSEAYAGRVLALSLSSSIYAGSNPAVRRKTHRRWIGFCPSGHQKKYVRGVCLRVRYKAKIRCHSAAYAAM